MIKSNPGTSWLAFFLGYFLLGAAAAQVSQQPGTVPAPKITDVQVLSSPTGDAKKTSLALDITGEHLCKPGEKPRVEFLINGKSTLEGKDTDCPNEKEVVATAELAMPSEITEVRILTNGKPIRSQGYKVSIRPNAPPPQLKEFQIKFDHQKNAQFPNLHSVLITKESGDPGVGFDVNPNHMQVELIPTGATDLKVVQSNEQQMNLHFVAAADYVPQEVVVTVFSSSDLDHRQPIAVAKPFQEKKTVDPDQPSISSVDLLFLERSQGRGRIRINGTAFGKYDPPPYPVDQYLRTHLQLPSIQGTDPDNPSTIRKECLEAIANAKKYQALIQQEHAVREPGSEDLPLRPVSDADECDKDTARAATAEALTTIPYDKWPAWQEKIRQAVEITLTSRNPDLRIDKTVIININDEMIDVYFEFIRQRGFSEPLRLKNVQVTFLKKQQQSTETAKGEAATATVTGPALKAYTAQSDIGPKSSAQLTFDYTMLDDKQANVMLGKGIAQNFYVLKVSVVNDGTKKVSVPLAAIQAEVEWARGKEAGDSNPNAPSDADDTSNTRVDYLEGATTVTPSPLGAVSAYFDAYNKNKGKRAVFFNILDALTVAGAALVPYTGPSFKDAQVFWSGGFVPAVHKGLGDISGQQLQNLTTLSWQNIESIPPQGGSLMKLIYIQKSPQFQNQPVTLNGKKRQTKKVITNLLNLDITGFEIEESQATQATHQSADQNKGASSTGNSAAGTGGSTTPTTAGSTGAEKGSDTTSKDTTKNKTNKNKNNNTPGKNKDKVP